jgi:hypothetical protein
MTPQRPPHPMLEAQEMHRQLPVQTPFTGSTAHLIQHAVPIFHQLMALKKALGSPKTGDKNNPGGVPNAI